MKLCCKLYFADKTLSFSTSDCTPVREGDTTLYRAEVEGIQINWRFTPYACGTLISLDASSEKPLGIRRIDSVSVNVGAPQKTDRIPLMGRNYLVDEALYPHEMAVSHEYGINCVGLFENLAAKGVLLAGVDPFLNVYNSTVCKNADGTLTLAAATEYTEGQTAATALSAERAFLCENTTIDAFFTAFRPLLPQSKFPMPKLTGWNTWDYYLDRVTPADISENVAALKGKPFADALDYIVIDDGWQKEWGMWRENDKFACGLAAVADEIRAAGFTPGIWMAPVAVGEGSYLFTEHPDWFCKDESGAPFFDPAYYYLDPTHPEAEAFILNNYIYQYKAGFRLFKMDYISPLLKVKSFYDKNATPYGAIKAMVAKVIAATGEDVVILGCSLPLECGADVAPSMRIAVDIHNHFTHVAWIARAMAWSWMYNNKITRIDPDFLVVRGEETATEPVFFEGGARNDFVPPARHLQTDNDRFMSRWRHGDQFNAVEAETWANLVAILGGNIFLSDKMSVLNERGVAIIENALRLAGDEVRPVYLAEDERLPSLWRGDKALLLVNWRDVPQTLTVSGVNCPIRSDKPFSLEGDRLTVTLLPHESFGALYL